MANVIRTSKQNEAIKRGEEVKNLEVEVDLAEFDDIRSIAISARLSESYKKYRRDLVKVREKMYKVIDEDANAKISAKTDIVNANSNCTSLMLAATLAYSVYRDTIALAVLAEGKTSTTDEMENVAKKMAIKTFKTLYDSVDERATHELIVDSIYNSILYDVRKVKTAVGLTRFYTV